MQILRGNLKPFEGEAVVLCETVHQPQCQLGNHTRNQRLVEIGQTPIPEPPGGFCCTCDPVTTLTRLSNKIVSTEEGRAIRITETFIYEQQTTTNEKEQ